MYYALEKFATRLRRAEMTIQILTLLKLGPHLVGAINCPPCKEVLGSHPLSGQYTLDTLAPASSCPNSCLYRNDQNVAHCFKPGGMTTLQGGMWGQCRNSEDVGAASLQDQKQPTTTTTTMTPAKTSRHKAISSRSFATNTATTKSTNKSDIATSSMPTRTTSGTTSDPTITSSTTIVTLTTTPSSSITSSNKDTSITTSPTTMFSTATNTSKTSKTIFRESSTPSTSTIKTSTTSTTTITSTSKTSTISTTTITSASSTSTTSTTTITKTSSTSTTSTTTITSTSKTSTTSTTVTSTSKTSTTSTTTITSTSSASTTSTTTITNTSSTSTTSVPMAVRSNLYLQAGGQGSEGPLLAPRLYNSNGTLPESPPELPMALIGGVGGTLGPLSLLCGGSPSNCWTSNLTSSWVKSPLSYPSLSYPAAGALGAGVWVSGGKISLGRRRRRREVMELELREALGRRHRASRVGEDTLATLLFRYNASTETVSSIPGPRLTEQRLGHCAVTWGNRVILIGGFGTIGYLGLVESYSMEVGDVETLPLLQEGRMSHGCTSFSGAGGEGLLVAGGWRGFYIDTVEMLQGSAPTWTFVKPLPQMRMFSAMTSLGGRPVIVGGAQYSDGWKYRNSTLVFMVELGLWQEAPLLSLQSGQVRGHTLISLPDKN